ncbi:DUF4349 domain-containing protein [Flavobacterium enshiense]|uniref:DUF4349 domain-containing protein n=1 Tax=Flavobacterium enshiense TaxID=1341165 RepID=UPI00345DC0B0
MKTIPRIGMAALLLVLAYSCKEASEAKTEEVATTESSTDVISSSAAVEKKDSNRKFVRTVDLQFKVKNVAKSTYSIENVTNKFGGFVTYTNLQSHVNEKEETRVSQDSILETTKYTVENDITIRVPNTKLDTLLKSIAKEIDFLDSRVIKADDVTLQLLSNKMAQKRSASTENRIEKAIDEKGKKLNNVIDAEENLANKKEQNDNAKLNNLSLNDQINFSTVSIKLYQREAIKHELYASEKSINKYRPHLGLQIWDSLKTGWYMLESIIAFIVQLWALILIGVLGYIGYKKVNRKQQ